MEVQCEQKKCAKVVDLRDEACFCLVCQKYYCEPCYDKYHSEHDNKGESEPNWVMAMQR